MGAENLYKCKTFGCAYEQAQILADQQARGEVPGGIFGSITATLGAELLFNEARKCQRCDHKRHIGVPKR